MIQGEAVSSTDKIPLSEAKNVALFGFGASVPHNSEIKLINCASAVVVVTAGPGNFIPNNDGSEVYSTPKILSFVCND